MFQDAQNNDPLLKQYIIKIFIYFYIYKGIQCVLWPVCTCNPRDLTTKHFKRTTCAMTLSTFQYFAFKKSLSEKKLENKLF